RRPSLALTRPELADQSKLDRVQPAEVQPRRGRPPGVSGGQLTAALLADDLSLGLLPAVLVDYVEGVLAGWPQPAVAPAHERQDDRQKIPAFFREAVFPARRVLLIGAPLQYPPSHQPFQAVGQDVARDPEAPLEVLEAPQPQKRVTDDEQRPPIAHLLQAGG